MLNKFHYFFFRISDIRNGVISKWGKNQNIGNIIPKAYFDYYNFLSFKNLKKSIPHWVSSYNDI